MTFGWGDSRSPGCRSNAGLGDFRRCLISVTCHIMSHCITYLGLLCELIFGNSGDRPEAVIIGVWGFWEVRYFPLDVTKPHKISHIFDFLPESSLGQWVKRAVKTRDGKTVRIWLSKFNRHLC